MPWKETAMQDERLRFMVAALRPGASLSGLCREFGISRPTGRKWRARAQTASSLSAAVTSHSTRPHQSPRQTPPAVVDAIVALRQQYGWAGAKLQPLLRAQGYAVAVATIDRVIRRAGLIAPVAHRPARQRFEQPAPNALWQMDFKGAYPYAPGVACHALAILDDHSRFAVALAALPSIRTAGVRETLQTALTTYGLPDALLIDHGAPWWHRSTPHGLTPLSVWLLAQGIALRRSGVRHPQTQGKVERFHRTLGQYLRHRGVPTDTAGFAAAFAQFRTDYNEIRPHAALGYQPPATRYTPSGRPYCDPPPPWTYPVDMHIVTVDRHGRITVGGRAYFVSDALIDHVVGYQDFPDRLLVAFRHLYVREIRLDTGDSLPLAARVPPLETRS
jgi:transposase InsO family protein